MTRQKVGAAVMSTLPDKRLGAGQRPSGPSWGAAARGRSVFHGGLRVERRMRPETFGVRRRRQLYAVAAARPLGEEEPAVRKKAAAQKV